MQVEGGDEAGAAGGRDADAAQVGLVESLGFGEEAPAAAADRDETDASPVEAGKLGVGGEAGVEDEVAEGGAVATREGEEFEGDAVAGVVAESGVALEHHANCHSLSQLDVTACHSSAPNLAMPSARR